MCGHRRNLRLLGVAVHTELCCYHPEGGDVVLVVDEHRHVAVEVTDAAVLHAERQQVANLSDAFGEKGKLDLGHGIEPTGGADADGKVGMAKKGIISESKRHSKPLAVFQCHMADTSLICRLFTLKNRR